MDFFVQKRIPEKVLKILNRCRVYLQVIFVSDIADATGTIVLNSIKHGRLAGTRKSNLNWPAQPRPPSSTWSQWRTAIANLEENGHLAQPLGEWRLPSHQQWDCYYYTATKAVYQRQDEQWFLTQPAPTHSIHHTRSSSASTYSLLHRAQTESLPAAVCPATVISLPGQSDKFIVRHSETPIPLAEGCTNGNAHFTIEDGAKEPHPFYKTLLQWDTNAIMPHVAAITEAIQGGGLFMCADGSFIKDRQQGVQAWVLSTSDGTVLWRGAGPSIGHPKAMMAYRAELCGLTSAFFLLLWVCNESDLQHGSAVIYCDNETALNEVFKNPLTTNNPYAYLAADIDLITCARDLLLHCPLRSTSRKSGSKAITRGKSN
jgi:hypothetical protein